MEDLQVEQRGKVLVVTIEGIEHKVPMAKAEEVAREWEISNEIVAQMYAIVTYAAECEEDARKLTWKKFAEGYGRILQTMSPEELINRMVDNFGNKLLNPEKFYEIIQMGG